MATLYIAELQTIGGTANFPAPIAMVPALTQQTVVIGAGSLQSNAFGANIRMVRIHTDAICSIQFGTNPTATTATMRMAANQTEYFAVDNYSAPLKVAVIANT